MIFSRNDDVTEAVCTHYEGVLVARLFKFGSINDYPPPRPPADFFKADTRRMELHACSSREPYRAKFLEWINSRTRSFASERVELIFEETLKVSVTKG